MTVIVLVVLQEWDRCKSLAVARHLTQQGRAHGPAMTDCVMGCCPKRLSGGIKDSMELNDVARYVAEDLNEDLFRELMGYMPECRQDLPPDHHVGAPSSPPQLAQRPKGPPIPNSIMTYSLVHLKPHEKLKVPTLAPERFGPSLSSKEYRVPVLTPAMAQRPRVMTVKKPADHPADNTPTQYSRIRFAKKDIIMTYGPRWGHNAKNGCCGKGRHICHNTDTWLSRNELRAIHDQRCTDSPPSMD